MTELDQFCEIYGHEWISYYLCYGLVLGSQTIDMSQICYRCKKTDNKIFVPYKSNISNSFINRLLGEF